MEVVDAGVREFGRGRIGVRLSPFGIFNSMPADPDVEGTLLYLAKELGRRGVAYLHFLCELTPSGNMETAVFKARHLDHALMAKVRELFPGAIIWCGGFDSREGAEAALKTGLVDLIAFGRPFIGNPDLPERLKNGWALTVADRSTHYTRRGEIGFTDFPDYAASRAGEH
jgi:N-ethylmaleimide reductase